MEICYMKTRQEQIKEAARQRADQYSHPVDWSDTYYGFIAYYGFIDGAKWADKHPQWIPVEEELPKENQSVFICNARRDYGTALYQGGEWFITREYVAINVTHWMPIVPPRKEE